MFSFLIAHACQRPLQHRERHPLTRIKMEGHGRMSFRSSILGRAEAVSELPRSLALAHPRIIPGLWLYQRTDNSFYYLERSIDLLGDRTEMWTYGFWTLKPVFIFVLVLFSFITRECPQWNKDLLGIQNSDWHKKYYGQVVLARIGKIGVVKMGSGVMCYLGLQSWRAGMIFLAMCLDTP